MEESIIHVQWNNEDIIKILSGFRCDRCKYWGQHDVYPDARECTHSDGDTMFLYGYEDPQLYTNKDFFCKSFTPLTNG